MRFRLTPRLMTLDDLELLQGRILSEFRGISKIWGPSTAKRMKIDPYCQRRNCSPLNVLFTARCTLVQSAVLRSHVVSLSVCL